VRVPETGLLKIGDDPGSNEQVLNICLFDGYVAERDNMQLTLLPVEEDLLDPDDLLPLYSREFSHPPEAWVGSYGPNDEVPGGDAERQASWLVWYRIESLPL
jgi:hypothetical protein